MPSSVVIAFPLTAATGVTHERISLPSSSTEHAPHCARPQPNRGPCRWSSLCRTYKSGVSRPAVTLCTRPFTLIFNLLAIKSPFATRPPERNGSGVTCADPSPIERELNAQEPAQEQEEGRVPATRRASVRHRRLRVLGTSPRPGARCFDRTVGGHSYSLPLRSAHQHGG